MPRFEDSVTPSVCPDHWPGLDELDDSHVRIPLVDVPSAAIRARLERAAPEQDQRRGAS